ncbi:MAG TPA: hypothetical protein VLB50_03140 [Ignavibacteriaceae bacterium]|nr:hypothetical protein [Ignavibacteriaceae bacterium]
MKKLISIGLSFLIILNTFGFNIILIYMLQVYRIERLEFIDEHPDSIPPQEFVVFSLSKDNLHLINTHEIIHNNEMYDIICRVKLKDDIIFYCINDKKDTRLHNSFCSFNEIKDNPISASGHLAVDILKNLLKHYLSYPVLQFNENIKKQQFSAVNYISLPIIILSKISPPPENRS